MNERKAIVKTNSDAMAASASQMQVMFDKIAALEVELSNAANPSQSGSEKTAEEKGASSPLRRDAPNWMPSGTEKSAGSHNDPRRSGSGAEKTANDPGPQIPEFPIHTPRDKGTTGASE